MSLSRTVNGLGPTPSTPFGEVIGSLLYEFRWLAADTWMLTWRMLMHYRRNPELLASTTLSPIMFPAVIQLRLWWRNRRQQGIRLHRLSRARRHHPEQHLHRHASRSRSCRRHEQGSDRPIPIPPNGAFRLNGRTRLGDYHRCVHHRLRHPRIRARHRHAFPWRILASIRLTFPRRRISVSGSHGYPHSSGCGSAASKPHRR